MRARVADADLEEVEDADVLHDADHCTDGEPLNTRELVARCITGVEGRHAIKVRATLDLGLRLGPGTRRSPLSEWRCRESRRHPSPYGEHPGRRGS